MNIIVVSEHHKMPVPLLYNLGTHMLVITSDGGAPHAYELVAPKGVKGAEPDEEAGPVTVIFDPDETYNLYQCLHELFRPASPNE